MAVLKRIKKNQGVDSFGKANAKSSAYDELNKKIISFLQEDGRMSFKDIAIALDVSEGTIRNRVQWMKEAGVLKIVALADPMAIRYQADAMIGIKVSNSSSPSKVAQRLSAHSEVVYVVWVSGRFDLMIEIVCETSEDFQSFLEGHCFNQDDIDQFEIMTAIEMFKNQFLLKRQSV
ncbi:MAG: Lrp/AsnC family transcriptional regulator for asnA, asnC and gidA [Saprospiraceae bacterium]|jgi:Lrp/AsnC family transcriptional regulator for asnA, asnC and gidA